MDAKTFGAFLADARRNRGLTQAELAELLHVTDKAVSRWERGVGFPDINTLEPLTNALDLTLSQLMHASASPEAPPGHTLEEAFALLCPDRIRWSCAKSALFWMTVGLAVWMQFTLPPTVIVHWHQEAGSLIADRTSLNSLVCLLCIGASALLLQLSTAIEQGGFFRFWIPLFQIRFPRLGSLLELAGHLYFYWLMLRPLFVEATILLLN